MTMIQKRSDDEKTRVRLTATVTKVNMDTLLSYAAFLGEETGTAKQQRAAIDFVVNRAIELLATDKEFRALEAPKRPVRRSKPKSVAA